LQGEKFSQAAQALRNGDVEGAALDQPHRLLLEFVKTITEHAYRVTDEQIAEAAYDAALFNLFVRLADTFGIEPPAMYEPGGIPSAATQA
jgi:hypothetical protein